MNCIATTERFVIVSEPCACRGNTASATGRSVTSRLRAVKGPDCAEGLTQPSAAQSSIYLALGLLTDHGIALSRRMRQRSNCTASAVPRACIADESLRKRTLSSSFRKSSAQRVGAMQATMAAQPCSGHTRAGLHMDTRTHCSGLVHQLQIARTTHG